MVAALLNDLAQIGHHLLGTADNTLQIHAVKQQALPFQELLHALARHAHQVEKNCDGKAHRELAHKFALASFLELVNIFPRSAAHLVFQLLQALGGKQRVQQGAVLEVLGRVDLHRDNAPGFTHQSREGREGFAGKMFGVEVNSLDIIEPARHPGGNIDGVGIGGVDDFRAIMEFFQQGSKRIVGGGAAHGEGVVVPHQIGGHMGGTVKRGGVHEISSFIVQA